MHNSDPAHDPTINSNLALGATITPDEPSAAAAPEVHARAALPHYELGAILGRGGMGDIVLGRDPTIGRHVAIKRMRTQHPTPAQVSRFLREARIQARLEHPAIPPVHELGHDPAGQPYFAMKRLTGVTLAESLASPAPMPRQRLLRVFADVCRAIEFAHAQGVVHRDLKPANIMLGRYGEVYVLDWGLARITADAESEAASMQLDVDSLDGEAREHETQAGALLGTPGYMAPEQAHGARDVTPAADIYALGAILFDILAGESLHPRGIAVALKSTLSAIDVVPSHRRADREIPPELDALCAAALAMPPADRPPARDLAARIEGYLDGDRDLEQRRQLAEAEVTHARALLATADPAQCSEAMRAAGRAIAIAPSSRAATDLVAELMFAPRRDVPPELATELDELDGAQQQRQSRVAMLSFLAVFIYLGTAAVAGIRSWAFAGVLAGLTGVLAVFAWRLSQRRATQLEMLITAAGNALLVGLLSRTFGSLVIVPGVTCVMAVSLTSYPHLIKHVHVVIAMLIASWLVPIVLERAGAIDPTWSVVADGVREGTIVSRSGLVAIGGAATTALLVGAHLVTFVVIGLFANALARSRREAQQHAALHAWHVRQFLPIEADRLARLSPSLRLPVMRR